MRLPIVQVLEGESALADAVHQIRHSDHALKITHPLLPMHADLYPLVLPLTLMRGSNEY
jgi:hypothetical protein